MAQSGTAKQLRFLENSAQYLSTQSPSTAAHLMSAHNHIMLEESKSVSATQQREFCGACGSIRLPGWTSSVSTRTRSARKSGRRVSKSTPPQDPACTEVVYTCLRCHREAIQRVQKPPKSTAHRKIRSQPSTAVTSTSASPAPVVPPQHTTTTTPKPKTVSDNASSKKRAKSRKHQGLLALLDKQRSQSQPQPSTSSSLDLLDFLQ